MKAYAIGNLVRVEMGPAIVNYLKRIDATLSPFGGRLLIHGGEKVVLEGNWSSDVIVIEFPDIDRARTWYASPAYQDIVHLRRDSAEGAVILMEGVGEDHAATNILS